MMKKLLPVLLLLLLALPALAAEPAATCKLCNMKVDAKHNVQYRYVLTSGEKVAMCSLSCAKRYWSQNKEAKLVFEATDFVTGKWAKADDGVFLVGGKLDVGTGMDRVSVVFFTEETLANKAKAANGGKITKLPEALKRAAGEAHHHH